MRGAHLVLFASMLAGCNQSDFGLGEGAVDPDGPGTPQWGDPNVECHEDADCHFGEACDDGVCQMKRCGDSYESIAPLGEAHRFARDQEVVVADASLRNGAYRVDGYLPHAGAIGQPTGDTSWSSGKSPIVDLAGGALIDQDDELVVVAAQGSSTLLVPALDEELAAGFQPIALAAGDVDRDGRDEVVALGAAGQVAICQVDEGGCARHDLGEGTTGVDVAVGDVDRDGVDEAVFHVSAAGQSEILIVNLDAEAAGQPPLLVGTSPALASITTADLDGDGRAEIVALEDGGWLGWGTDHLVTFRVADDRVTQGAALALDRGAIDIAGGDLDRDRRDELVLLTDRAVAQVFRGDDAGALAFAGETSLASSGSPTRIATVDVDGDSSVGHLVSGPELVAGEVVPTMVMYVPPYYETHSAGRPTMLVGSADITETDKTDSVGLSLGVTVGFEGELPGIISGEIGAALNRTATTSTSNFTVLWVTSSFVVDSDATDPALYGYHSAAVVLGCGCFHAYTYELEDVGAGDGERFVVLVPVGGQTQMWSSNRYNAMARAVGTLPVIDIPMRVGDPRSYPATPSRVDGSPVADDDLAFTRFTPYRVSDVAGVDWDIYASDVDTNRQAFTTGIEASGSVSVAGFSVGGDIGLEWEQGYAVGLGAAISLAGTVPPIADDPSTPEDEYATYAYDFVPSVYREYYDEGGTQAAYYVVNYAASF